MSTEKKVLSQNDITMLKVYYYFKDNPDKLNEDLPKTITRPDIAKDSKKVYSVSSDNWKFLKGINKDGTESKVGAVLGFDTENGNIKLKISGAKSRAEISKRRIEKILEEIENGSYELSDISFGDRIITIEEQKEFLKLLDESLKDYIEKESVSAKKKTDTPKKDNYTIIIGNSKKITDNTIHIKTDEDSSDALINSIASILNLKITIENVNSKIKYLSDSAKDDEKMKTEIEKLQEQLTKLLEEKGKLEEELKKKYENSDKTKEYTSLVHLIDTHNEIIESYNNKIKQLEQEIEKVIMQIDTFSEDEKKTPEGNRKYNALLKQKEKLLIKKVGLSRALKICTEERDRYSTILKSKTETKVETIKPNPIETHYSYVDEIEPERENIQSVPENQELQETERNNQPFIMLGYYDLNIFDRFRAKVEAYKKLNGKEPNIFRKITLFFPSFKYSSKASDYIVNGDIELENVIGNMNRYRKAIYYEESENQSSTMSSYRVDRPINIDESRNNPEGEHNPEIEEDDFREL